MSVSVATSQHSIRNHALRIEEQGRVFCYSGDGAPSPETRELFRGAHLLVHECFTDTDSIPGHAHATQLLDLAEWAGVETLCLVHLEQSDANKRRVADLARSHAGRARVILPAPGDVLPI